MKLSNLLNEYDYLGKTYDGYEFRIWENPSPEQIKQELNKLENDSEYLRGYLSWNGNLYISSYGSYDHSDLRKFLTDRKLNPEFPAMIYRNEDVGIFDFSGQYRNRIEKLIEKYHSNNGNWNLYYIQIEYK